MTLKITFGDLEYFHFYKIVHETMLLACLFTLFSKQAYYLPETEYVHWARAHPVRKSAS